jgi:glycine dehydrogenase subunit 1
VRKSHYACDALVQDGNCRTRFAAPFFNEFVLELSDARTVWQQLSAQHIIAGVVLEDWYPELKNCLLLCVTEMHTRAEIERLAAAIGARGHIKGKHR